MGLWIECRWIADNLKNVNQYTVVRLLIEFRSSITMVLIYNLEDCFEYLREELMLIHAFSCRSELH